MGATKAAIESAQAATLRAVKNWLLTVPPPGTYGATALLIEVDKALSASTASPSERPALPRETVKSEVSAIEAAPTAAEVWRVCELIHEGGCKRCPPSEMHHGDECVRGCYLQATECVNTVQTGNPWRKTSGVREPWVSALTALPGGGEEQISAVAGDADARFSETATDAQSHTGKED